MKDPIQYLKDRFARYIQNAIQRNLNRKYTSDFIKYNVEQFNLIQQKRCTLSRAKRDIIENNVSEMILKGIIKIELRNV